MCFIPVVLYETRRRWAMLLARCNLHRIAISNARDKEIVSKSRRKGSRLLIAAGNAYLRTQGAGVEVLSLSEWLRWEETVRTATDCDRPRNESPVGQPMSTIEAGKDCLTTRRVPGEPLSRVLSDPAHGIGERMRCFHWAVEGLEELHGAQADWGHGRLQLLSHGDATCENVIVDCGAATALWIDFDTRHRAHLSSLERHADDLRALVFSSAVHVPESEYHCLAHQLRDGYTNSAVLARLRHRLITEWHRPTSFQLAQAPLPYRSAVAMGNVLLDVLP